VSAPVGQQGAELCQHALILRCAAVVHNLLHWGEDPAQGHAHRQGSNRGAQTSTVLNNDRSCRSR
jgi:hypothetical protein